MINKKKIGSAVFVYIFNTNFSKILLEKRNLEKSMECLVYVHTYQVDKKHEKP